MPNAELNIVARMTDLASSQIQRLRGEVWMLSRVTDQTAGTITRYDKALSGLMVGGILTSISRGIFSMVEANNEFNETLIRTRNNTTMAIAEQNRAAVSLGQYREAVLQISTDVGAASEQVAEGFQHAFNYANDMTVAIAETAMASKSARANYADLEKTVDLLANVMHQYGLDVLPATLSETEKLTEANKRAAHTMGLLDRAAAMGNMTVEEFVQAAGRAFGAASRYSISLEETSAAYVTLTKRGFNAAQAQTQLTNIITKASAPTKEQSKYIKELAQRTGIDLVKAYSAVGLEQYGLLGVIDMTRAAFAKLGYSQAEATQAAYKLINAQRGGQGLAVLLTSGYEDMKDALGILSDANLMARTTTDQFNDASENLVFNLGTIKTIVQNVGKQIAQGMEGPLTAVSKALIPLLKGLYQFVSDNKQLVGTLALVLGVVTGVTGVLMTLGATAILLGPIFKAGALAVRSLTGAAGESSGATKRQIAAFQALQAAEARAAATTEVLASVERGRVAAARLAVDSTSALKAAGDALAATHKAMLGAVTGLTGAIRLKAKEIKGLTQAEIDEAAIAKTGAAAKAAEATKTALATAAIREQATVVAAETTTERAAVAARNESLRVGDMLTKSATAQVRAITLRDAASRSSTRATILLAQADEAEAKAAGYAAQATAAGARAVSLANVQTAQAIVVTRADTAAKWLQESATAAGAAATKLYMAETMKGLTVAQRQVVLENALADQEKAHAKASEALAATKTALNKATEAAVVAETEMNGALKGTAEGVAAYTRAQGLVNDLRAMSVNISRTLVGIERDMLVTQQALAATTRGTTTSYYNLTIALKGVQVATLRVSEGFVQAMRAVAVSVAVARASFGTLLAVARALATYFVGLVRTISAVGRALLSLGSAAVSAGRFLANVARASWAFVTAGRAGARAADQEALAMQRLGLSAGLAGDALGKTAAKGSSLLGFLGGLAGKLLGLGLTAMIVYDMWESNFLGLKDLTARIFGGVIETTTETAKALTGAAGLTKPVQAELEKLLKISGKVRTSFQKNGNKIVETLRTVGDATYRTTEIWGKNGKLISRASERVTESVGQNGEKIKTYVMDVGDSWRVTTDTFDKNGKKIKTTVTTTKKEVEGAATGTQKALQTVRGVVGDVASYVADRFNELVGTLTTVRNFLAGLFSGGTWDTLWRFVDTLERVFGPETARLARNTFWRIKAAVESAFATIQNLAANVGETLGYIGDAISGIFSGNLEKAIVGIGQAIRKIFGNEAAQRYWEWVAEHAQDAANAIQNVRKWVEKLSTALNKLIDTGDLGAFFQEMMPTEAEWQQIWAGVSDLAGKALVAAFDIRDAARKAIGKVWTWLFGGRERVDAAGARGAEVWADGIVQTALKELRAAWDRVAPTLGSIVATVWGWLFGREERVEAAGASNVTTWSEGIFARAWRALSDEWNNNVRPKIEGLVGTVWTWLFGGEVKEPGSDTTRWSEGIFSKAWGEIKRIWNTYEDDLGALATSVWRWIFGGPAKDDKGNETGKWADGIVQKAWAAVQTAFTKFSPTLKDLGTILFGGQRIEFGEQGEVLMVDVEGLIPSLLRQINQAMLDLADQIESNAELSKGANAAGETIARTITGLIGSFFDKGGGESGFQALGTAVFNNFIIPFVGGFVKGAAEGALYSAGQILAAIAGIFTSAAVGAPTSGELEVAAMSLGGEAKKQADKGIQAKFGEKPDPAASDAIASYTGDVVKEGAEKAKQDSQGPTIWQAVADRVWYWFRGGLGYDITTKAGELASEVGRGWQQSAVDFQNNPANVKVGNDAGAKMFDSVVDGMRAALAIKITAVQDIFNSLVREGIKGLRPAEPGDTGGLAKFVQGVIDLAAGLGAHVYEWGAFVDNLVDGFIASLTGYNGNVGKQEAAFNTWVLNNVAIPLRNALQNAPLGLGDWAQGWVDSLNDRIRASNTSAGDAMCYVVDEASSRAEHEATIKGGEVATAQSKGMTDTIRKDAKLVADTTFSCIEDAASKATGVARDAFSDVGASGIKGIQDGIDASQAALNDSAREVVKQANDAAGSQAEDFTWTGILIDRKLSEGIDTNVGQVKTSASAAVAQARDSANGVTPTVRNVGAVFDTELTRGIRGGQADVNAAARSLVNQATAEGRSAAYSDGLTIGQRISAGLAAGLTAAEARLRALRIQVDQVTNYKRSSGGFFAAGGRVTTEGYQKVGERGPEYVQLPRGTVVYNATQTRARERESEPQTTYQFNLTQQIQGPAPTPIQGFQALRAWARA